MTPNATIIRFATLGSRVLTFFAAGILAAWLVLSSGFVGVRSTLDMTRYQAEIGKAFIGSLGLARTPYFYVDERYGLVGFSVLKENDLRLGAPRSLHQDIRTIGNGRYSVWARYLYFSTSDNTDPRTNGRAYTLTGPVAPVSQHWLLVTGLLAAGLGIGHVLRRGASRLSASAGVADRTPALLAVLPFFAGVAIALAPVVTRLRLQEATLSDLPFFLVLLGIASILTPALAFPVSSLRSSYVASRIIRTVGIAAALLLALVTSGTLMGWHSVKPESVQHVKGQLYTYDVSNLPLFSQFVTDEERTLSLRPILQDRNGPLTSGQSDARIEQMPGGLYSALSQTFRFSYRNAGGPTAPENGMTVNGSLRFDRAITLLLLGMLLSAVLVSNLALRSGFAVAVDKAPDLRRAMIAGSILFVLGLAGMLIPSSLFPATETALTLKLRLTQAITLTGAVLVLSCLPWRVLVQDVRSRPGPAASVAILLAAFAMPFAGLADAWIASGRINTHSQTGFHILGSMQASDSFGYLHGALELLTTGTLNDWNSRRPLTGVLTTLRMLAGAPDMQVIMGLGALLVAAGLTLATREIMLALGGWAALAFATACGAFVSEWTPTTLSESTGFAMGAFGLAAILAAVRRDQAALFGLGVMVLAIGLMARAGPFFLLPLVILAGAANQWRRGRKQMALWLVAGGVGGVLGFAHSPYLVKMLGGSSGLIQSNFSYTLYGLAVGGKGWQQIFVDHPQLFASTMKTPPEPAIYAFAIEAIRAKPSLIVKALMDELLRTPEFFLTYFDLTVINIWLIFGALIALVSFRNPVALIGLAAAAGIVLSSPLLLTDGGTRVYAAGVPLMGLLVALGFDAFRRGLANLMQGAGAFDLWRTLTSPTLPPAMEPAVTRRLSLAGVGAFAVVALIAAAPLIIGPGKLKPVDQIAALDACPAGERRLYAEGRIFADIFDVRADSEPGFLLSPTVRQSELLHATKIIGPVFAQALAKASVPYTLRAVAEVQKPENPRAVYPLLAAFPKAVSIPRESRYWSACVATIGHADSDSIGGLEVVEIRSVQPAQLITR
ncbi:MAG TPA: hypothetical protein PK812_01475 [Beijerinckiaceae bacterium]|nr:hypothetical protein [Beijerinckiaceae bacterium]